MRIRSIRPEFWTSEDIASLDWETRLIYIGLWSYVDDNGVGRDNEKLIVADLFPLEEDYQETLARVSRGLRKLSERGLVLRYSDSSSPKSPGPGNKYLFVAKWDLHQRVTHPNKDRYPRPTSENTGIDEGLARVSGESHESLVPGEGEKGRRGEEEKTLFPETGNKVEDPEEQAEPETPTPKRKKIDYEAEPKFAEFWEQYPRKDAKADALKAWRQVTTGEDGPKVDPEVVLAAVRKYPFDITRPKFIPLPASWLRGRRWEDAAVAPGQSPAKLFDVSKLPAPGEGWYKWQIDMVLGKDDWVEPEPPDDRFEHTWQADQWVHDQKDLHWRDRVNAAIAATEHLRPARRVGA